MKKILALTLTLLLVLAPMAMAEFNPADYPRRDLHGQHETTPCTASCSSAS